MENNLGKLNAIFMQNINNLFKKNNGPKIIKEYISIIKNNRPLLKEYWFFENIENYKNDENVKEYINECIKYIDGTNKKELKSLNEKLSNFMTENKIKQINEIDNEILFENIHNLIFAKKSLKKINEKIESINEIVKHIKNNSKEETVNENKKYDIDDNFYQFAINKFNKKYSEKLNEEEKSIFKTITNAKDENEENSLFNEQKKECLSLTNKFLKESIDPLTKEKLLNVKEKLLEQSYNKNSYIQDILSFIELKKTLL